MRLRSTLKWFLGGVTLALVAGSAMAQQPPTAPPPVTPGGAEARVGFQRQAQLTPAEQLTQADEILARMDQSSSVVRKQLERAREAHDVVKTLCLNDKLSQIDVATRSARERQGALRSAVGRNDAELSNHEFTILTVLRQRAEQLTADANLCIGEEVAFVGATQVVTTIDPTLPGEDTTQYPPTDPTLVSAPPQCISCNQ